jgi:hypothetical protein
MPKWHTCAQPLYLDSQAAVQPHELFVKLVVREVDRNIVPNVTIKYIGNKIVPL